MVGVGGVAAARAMAEVGGMADGISKLEFAFW
jgi:hypothetical protein